MKLTDFLLSTIGKYYLFRSFSKVFLGKIFRPIGKTLVERSWWKEDVLRKASSSNHEGTDLKYFFLCTNRSNLFRY